MDKITVLCTVLAVVPIIYALWTTRNSIFVLLRRLSHTRQNETKPESADLLSEYDCLLKAVENVEMDFQPNTGLHHSEETYLNRANLLREKTQLYQLINSL